jgi:hypothetical protein
MLIIQQILIKFFKNDSSLWTLSKKITQSDYLDNYVKKLKTTDLQTLLTNTLTHLENTDAGRSILAYLEMLKRKPAQIEKKQESITTFTNEYVKDPKTSLAPLFILLVDFAYVNKILGDKDLKDKLTNLINRFEPVDKDIKKKIKKIQTEEREEEEIKIKEKKSEEPKTAPLQKKPTESIKELQNKLKEACETIDKENDKEKKEKLIVTLEEVLNEFAEKIKEDPNKTSLVLETCYELIDIDEEDITNIIKNAFMATFKDVINDDFFNCMSLLKNNTLNIMAMGYNYYNNISTILEKINTIKNLEITAFFKKKFEQLKITTNLIKLFINSKNKRMKEEQEILHAFVQNYTSWLLNKEEIEEYKNKLKKEYMSQDKNSNSENINDIFVPISKKTENPPKKPELEEKEEIEIEEKKPIDPLSTALSLLKAKLLSLAKSLQED